MNGLDSSRWARGLAAVVVLVGVLHTAQARAGGEGGAMRHLDVGRALVEGGDALDGLRHVAVAVALAPDDMGAQTYLLAVLDLDRFRQDVGLHEAVAAVLPSFRPVLDRLARLYELDARYAEAAAVHLREVGLKPDDAETQARLAVYFYFMGERDLARGALARYRALGGDPEAILKRLPDPALEGGPEGPVAAPQSAVGYRSISLEPMAEAGDPLAMFIAGRKYLINAANTGRADLRDRGLGFLEGSAGAGFTPARRFLAALYLEGGTVPRDVPRAIAHLERAASAGDVIAQRELGDMYFTGTILARNLSRAAYWYQTILHHPDPGYKRADMWEIELRLGRLYMDGTGVERDPGRALALWRSAAEGGGSPEAEQALADAYAEGAGGGNPPAEAIGMYYSAATNYLERGFLHGLDRQQSRAEVVTILAAMERIQPDATLTRRLRTRLERLQ
jgi:TPR repeat protein